MRRRPRPGLSRPSRRKWPLAAAALAALCAWWLWPVAEAPPAAPAEPPRVALAALVAAPLHLRRTPPKIPAPRNALPGREALLAAVRERSAALRDCAMPGGALARLPLRLHVRQSGTVRAVDFTGEPPPAQVASCVRKAAMAWSFDPIALSSDVELLVAVSFTPQLAAH